jgi:hypothetical protein
MSYMRNRSEENNHPKWLGSPISFVESDIGKMRRHIPKFERRSFALTQPKNDLSRLNEYLDAIVRKPFGENHNFIPVGVVSKEYTLIQHAEVMDVAMTVFEESNIKLDSVKAELKFTAYGERMALSLYLRDEFSFDPGDGNLLALRLECFNSVEGSTRFRVLMGWLRK